MTGTENKDKDQKRTVKRRNEARKNRKEKDLRAGTMTKARAVSYLVNE